MKDEVCTGWLWTTVRACILPASTHLQRSADLIIFGEILLEEKNESWSLFTILREASEVLNLKTSLEGLKKTTLLLYLVGSKARPVVTLQPGCTHSRAQLCPWHLSAGRFSSQWQRWLSLFANTTLLTGRAAKTGSTFFPSSGHKEMEICVGEGASVGCAPLLMISALASYL